MPDSISWLRRVRRTLRVCAVSGVVFVMWSLVEGLASVMRPAFSGPALLLVLCAFVAWHWWRPRRFQRRRGPAEVRLRPLPRAAFGVLAEAIVLACIALEALFIVHLRLLPVPADDPFAWLSELARQPWGWVSVFAMTVLLAPVIEETVFRGWLQRPLERLWGPAAAVGMSATLFALIHFIPEYFPYYFVLGLVLGGLVVLTRSLWPSMLLHAAFNLQGLLLSFVPLGLEHEHGLAQDSTPFAVSLVLVVAMGILLARALRRMRGIVRPPRAPRGGPPAELTPQAAPVQ
jgi:uncharacterized protein